MPNYIGEFQQLVLFGILRLAKRAYGAAVVREVERRTERDISQGAFYTTIKRLERKGLISSELGEATARRGGKRKRYLSLTDKGRRALGASWTAQQEMAAGLDLVRLFCSPGEKPGYE